MRIIAEINQGRRTVLEYLLSPMRKAARGGARTVAQLRALLQTRPHNFTGHQMHMFSVHGYLRGLLRLAARLLFTSGICMSLSSCSNTLSWREEVKLADGRTIVVSQERRCASGYTGGNSAACIEREAWLRLRLPELGVGEITWHENLSPVVLNLRGARFYLVAVAPTAREFAQYGKPKPPYFGFVLEGGAWRRIAFRDIPEAVYDANLVLDGTRVKAALLTLAAKDGREFNGDPGYPGYFRRVDPHHVSKFN